MRNVSKIAASPLLVATGDVGYGMALQDHLEQEGHEVERCHDAQGVLRLVGRRAFDVILLDVGLADEADVDLVTYSRRQSPDAQVILLFDIAHLERAVEGIRHGAYFYLPNTSLPSDVALVAGKAIRSLRTQAAASRYEQKLFEETLGGTPAMKRVIEVVSKVAPTSSTVLLLGESGTGKELLANAIHRLSGRSDMPLIAINCAALPEQLLESEMFGHMKGAFTGAAGDKRGLFEEADGGTIFLDEIGDMSLVTQAKLLRVLQNGEIRPVGATASKRVDVRILAATNRDLEAAAREGAFREDLYFRLNVVQVRIPPLRERMDALPRLVKHFLAESNAQFGRNVADFDDQAAVLLRNYQYPGNVRELESIVAHAVIMSDGPIIHARDLPDQVREGFSPRLALPDYVADSIPSISEMEAQLIRTALDRLDGNQTEVARKLGISRSTLWRKMKEHDISVPT
jgi:DNA-binding NtrC family response regulator